MKFNLPNTSKEATLADEQDQEHVLTAAAGGTAPPAPAGLPAAAVEKDNSPYGQAREDLKAMMAAHEEASSLKVSQDATAVHNNSVENGKAQMSSVNVSQVTTAVDNSSAATQVATAVYNSSADGGKAEVSSVNVSQVTTAVDNSSADTPQPSAQHVTRETLYLCLEEVREDRKSVV